MNLVYAAYTFVSMSGMLDLSRDEKATCPPEPCAAADALLVEVIEDSAIVMPCSFGEVA